jgi:hypothetical protein
MEHNPAFTHVKDCKRINDQINTNERISVGNETSSFDDAECKHRKTRDNCEEAVCRKRRKHTYCRLVEVTCDSDVEGPPSKQIKLHRDVGRQNSKDSVTEVLHNSKKNSQIMLPSTVRASSSSTSGSSETHLQKGDTQHISNAKTLNEINLEHEAVNTGLHNMKRKGNLQC